MDSGKHVVRTTTTEIRKVHESKLDDKTKLSKRALKRMKKKERRDRERKRQEKSHKRHEYEVYDDRQYTRLPQQAQKQRPYYKNNQNQKEHSIVERKSVVEIRPVVKLDKESSKAFIKGVVIFSCFALVGAFAVLIALPLIDEMSLERISRQRTVRISSTLDNPPGYEETMRQIPSAPLFFSSIKPGR